MKLSTNFTSEEFAVSASHPELVEQVPTGFIKNLRKLVTTILQPARDSWGSSLTILSGYRPPALNKRVAGSTTSQHLYAQAADIRSRDAKQFFVHLMRSDLPLGQVIYYPAQNFVHVATPSDRYPHPTFFVSPASKVYNQITNTVNWLYSYA